MQIHYRTICALFYRLLSCLLLAFGMLMWVASDNFESMITPKSVCLSVVASECLTLLLVMKYSFSPILFFPISMCLHLSGWNFNNHLSLHCSRILKSCCSIS